MFEYSFGKLNLTKGDTGTFTFSRDGNSLADGDTVTLTIRERLDGPVVLQSISNGNALKLTHEQTKELKPGKYFFDIEYRSADGSIVHTVGPKGEYDKNCTIYPEVTHE